MQSVPPKPHQVTAKKPGSMDIITDTMLPDKTKGAKIMNIYEQVTDRIIMQMEKGVIPWRKPWAATGKAISRATGKPYSLLNQMLLGKPGEYVTFSECHKAGGYVRKGEKAQIVVFWKWIDKEDEETGEVKQIPFLKYYNVFHISQCENITAKHTADLPANPATADETAESVIADYVKREGVTIEHREGDAAYYQPAVDRIVLPLLKQFAETAEYYSTAFHEMVHSTGHMKRLARLDGTAHFGGEEYSKEELIAEIGAAALVNHCKLETPDSFTNSAAYIQNWLQVLKSDNRFIVSAAGKAEKAVNLILAGQ